VADNLLLDDLEIGDLYVNGMRFTCSLGGPQSLASWRGEDDVVPKASGRDAGLWTPDFRDVAFHGIVQGDGYEAQDIRESFATRAALLVAKMQPDQLLTISAFNPHFGLAEGFMRTLANVRPQRITGPDPAELFWYEAWEITIELTCIDSPPDWSAPEAAGS
jgi:hypothetical protein